ncbi:alpha/beta hydrolase family protein [Agromyces humatus]|uniref:AB hydrolase-1 domain-containing protein n=1 Tax=Agromyces humatus TaxID=279573 RepID=A0ABN2KC50_9MICO|nr:chlorophyllase [Agromyces humatus]
MSTVTAQPSTAPIVGALDAIIGGADPVVSVAPVTLATPGRAVPLEARVSAPLTGSNLPVIVFSHGNGWPLDGYAPLASFWASRGFVVVQPTHLDSRRLGIGFGDPRFARIWLERIDDMTRILDEFGLIEAAVPGLEGRVNRDCIAAVGHSWGAQTVQTLLGARVLDADGEPGPDMSDPRVKAGVLLAATGLAGAQLHPFAAENFPFMSPSFAELSTPTLVVAGDRDQSRMSSRGPDWFTDAFTFSPGATDLLTLFGAEHSLGGIPGYEVAETTDENPVRVAVLQRLTSAYLRSALNPDDHSWSAASALLAEVGDEIGRVDRKRGGATQQHQAA